MKVRWTNVLWAVVIIAVIFTTLTVFGFVQHDYDIRYQSIIMSDPMLQRVLRGPEVSDELKEVVGSFILGVLSIALILAVGLYFWGRRPGQE